MKMTVVALAIVASMSAFAQVGASAPRPAGRASVEVPVDGSRVPGLDQAEAPKAEVQTPAPAVPAAPAATQGDLVLNGFSGPVPPRVRPSARRPGAEIDVEVGVNRTFAVAKGHVNRVVTPFDEAKVVTTSSASMRTEGGILYVSTNSDDPIGIFLHDAGNPENAISLTLIPDDIDPVSTRVKVRGLSAAPRRPVAAKREVAQTFETSSPYVEMLTGLLSELAHGRVPEGYGMADARTVGAVPQCSIPGLRSIPAQVITGSELLVVVYRGEALSTVTIDESKCSPDARAVAAWPRTELRPGEMTEVYAVFAVPQDSSEVQARPSVIGGAQ